jgi:hypothetical protein
MEIDFFDYCQGISNIPAMVSFYAKVRVLTHLLNAG